MSKEKQKFYEKMTDFFYNIYRFFDNTYVWVRNFFRWIVRVCQYAVFLWNDRDYDYFYIYRLLGYKLKRIRSEMENCKYMDKDTAIPQIKYVEELLEQVKNDEFDKDLYEEHDKKWGKMSMEHKEVIVDGQKYYEVFFNREKAITKQEKEQEREELLKIMVESDRRRTECVNKIFDEIKKNVYNWWV